jgi:hypothetical protein
MKNSVETRLPGGMEDMMLAAVLEDTGRPTVTVVPSSIALDENRILGTYIETHLFPRAVKVLEDGLIVESNNHLTRLWIPDTGSVPKPREHWQWDARKLRSLGKTAKDRRQP